MQNVFVGANNFSQTFLEAPAPAGQAFGINQTVVVWTSASNSITFDNNSAGDLGVFGRGCVGIGPQTSGIVGLPGGLVCHTTA